MGCVRFDDQNNKRDALFYLLEAERSTPKLGDPEHLNWRFFSPDELSELENISLTAVAALELLKRWKILAVNHTTRRCTCDIILPEGEY